MVLWYGFVDGVVRADVGNDDGFVDSVVMAVLMVCFVETFVLLEFVEKHLCCWSFFPDATS